MTVSFLRADEAYPNENCGICRDSLTEDVWQHDVHRFHGRCIAEWVKIEPTCPSCKKTVDTTSLLGENVLQRRVNELNQRQERKFTLQVIQMVVTFASLAFFLLVIKPGNHDG